MFGGVPAMWRNEGGEERLATWAVGLGSGVPGLLLALGYARAQQGGAIGLQARGERHTVARRCVRGHDGRGKEEVKWNDGGVLMDGDHDLVAGSACKVRAWAWSACTGMGDPGCRRPWDGVALVVLRSWWMVMDGHGIRSHRLESAAIGVR